MAFTRKSPALAAVALLALGLTACKSGDDSANDAATVLESTAERGPVRMRVGVAPDRVVVGEKVTLTIDVSAEEGVEIRMPEIDGAFGPFAVRSAQAPPDVPEDGRRRWLHRYELDTFAAGDAEIPAVGVEFTDRRPSALSATGEAVEGTIETEPLSVLVETVLAADVGEGDFRDIRGGVEVPISPEERRRRAFLVAGIAITVTVLLAVASLLILRRRGRPAAAPPPVPADVWALRELDALAEERLIERRAFHAFYFRLSDIVRQYIERRFGLQAPERTTEEFLRELRHDAALAPAHRELLEVFLRAADMVKFALHEPSPDESREAFDAARGFVEETRPARPSAVEAAA